jgi:hypothetical protein
MVFGSRGSSEYRENWSDSGDVLKVEPTEFLDGIDKEK